MILKILKKLKGGLVEACRIAPLLRFNIIRAMKLTFFGSFYKNDLFEAQFKNLGFVFRWKDFYMVNEVLVQNEYFHVLRLLKGIERPLIIDLGANIGTFSIYLLKYFPQSKVYSYEASAETFSILNMNKNMNTALDWSVFHAAVWKEDGVISFETKEFSGGSSINSQGNEIVPAVQLSTILEKVAEKRIVNLLKIDIEGAEEAVLLSQARNLLSCVENLVIELHPMLCNTNVVVDLLKENFDYLYEVSGRMSSKPLLVATRQKTNLPFFQQ